MEENVCIKIDMFSIYTCFKETDLDKSRYVRFSLLCILSSVKRILVEKGGQIHLFFLKKKTF